MNAKPHALLPQLPGLVAMALWLFAALSVPAYAAGPTATDFSVIPPTVQGGSKNNDPLVMLVMSNDQQLFLKAYNDYSDINGDGSLDTTYEDKLNYYGYFDSHRCYTYDSVDNYFKPTADASGTNNHYCSSAWSGNFLNWASMTRMDILRRVLYGGKRVVDEDAATAGTSDGKTVLERAFIPKDDHSFAKVYSGSDLAQLTPYSLSTYPSGITMCNTTRETYSSVSFPLTGESETITEPPKMRIAKGQWGRWASTNLEQCAWTEEFDAGLGNQPSAGTDKIATVQVKVQVCTSLSGKYEDFCKAYPNGDQKPVGLLQKYGEGQSEKMRFGLISGSYDLNRAGGVLRRDILPLEGNTDSTKDEINATTGQFTGNPGIVDTIDTFRVVQYNYKTGIYNDCNPYGILASQLGTSSTTHCSDWGNPIGEMYLEALRYFAGKTTPTSAFNADDSSYFSNLTQISTWTDPLTADNFCAKCSIIVLTSGANSFDMDDLGSATDVTGTGRDASDNPSATTTLDPTTTTNTVGSTEGISGSYLIGDNGTTNDGQCTAKSISNLSSAKGICPDTPTQRGGFDVAGMAWYAHTHDLRPDNNTTIGLPGDQSVDTYAVTLAWDLPRIKVKTGSDFITLMPACQATSDPPSASTAAWRTCTMVDVQWLSTSYDASGNLIGGTARVVWEDSTWGNDHDMDGVEDIIFKVSSGQLSIEVDAPMVSAGNSLRFGVILTGSTADGVHWPLLLKGPNNFNSISPGTDAAVTSSAVLYTPSGSAAGVLEPPLWYAAKWGGFQRLDGNKLTLNPPMQPSTASSAEWDTINNATGAFGSDGIPDNYFYADNPAQLETQLGQVFNRILARVSAGTAAAVISDSTTMTGAVIQALYQPALTTGGRQVTWGGILHSVFIDEYGVLHEDNNHNGRLDSTDKPIKILYDEAAKRTLVFYCMNVTSGNTSSCPASQKKDLEQLQPIWNARDELSKLDNNTIATQRNYTATSDTGRYIFTWIDDNGDNEVQPGEVKNFTDGGVDADSQFTPYLDLQKDTNGDTVIDKQDAKNVVDFIRGEENIPGTAFRSRTIDYNGDGTLDVWRLGDIVHSTPVTVGAPDSKWDSLYGDNTYTVFRQKYAHRRQMVYVGANDGMLHAFNAGFYDPYTKAFQVSPSGQTAHPLGGEMWAYVPKNLLPHLQWLTQPDYPHVYYMDGKPRIYDVNIFPTDAEHPDGWGTILVAGMRLGGGSITYDADGNPSTPDITSRSAYVILDITDPEQPPKLLAEFTDADLGFTTSTPTLVVKRVPGTGNDWSAPTVNDWYLVFGSGPNVVSTMTSTQNARLYALKLQIDSSTGELNLASTNLTKYDTSVTNSFVGDALGANWNLDFSYDAIYFGLAGGTVASPNGQLERLVLDGTSPSAWTMSTVINPSDSSPSISGQPFLNQPIITTDLKGERWIYGGTGRLYVRADNSSTAPQSFYGIKERFTSTDPNLPDGSVSFQRSSGTTTQRLQDVSGVKVYADGSVSDPNGVLPSSVTTFSQLENYIDANKAGWFMDFGTIPSAERVLTRATWDPSHQAVWFTTYKPSTSQCDAEGYSSIWAVYARTGTASSNWSFSGTSSTSVNGAGSPEMLPSGSLSKGTASEIVLYKTITGGVK
ncbi:MAG TPA: PilC/PilY family type IV pilus protein, partial [Gammaproteobacteria bacterium]|nr:PilC/PilY family type IV pilus protein [Gammaproteobacteria bacterium]